MAHTHYRTNLPQPVVVLITLLYAVLMPVAAMRAQSTASQPSTDGLARMSTRQLVRQAARDLAAGQYQSALSLYDESEKRIEDPALLSRIAYNKALAHEQAGQYVDAIPEFNQALANADVEMTTRVGAHLGECKYQLADAARAKPETLQEALELATSARDLWRSVIRDDATNLNARARLRDTARMLAEIRKQMEQQQQEQKQQDGDDEENQDEQQQEPSSQPTSQPNEQQSDEESQKQNQDKQQPGKDEKKDQSAENKPGEKSDSQQAQPGQADDANSNEARDSRPVKLTMSKEEAQRLLQLVRDKQRQRQEQKLKQEQQRARSTPVDKDW